MMVTMQTLTCFNSVNLKRLSVFFVRCACGLSQHWGYPVTWILTVDILPDHQVFIHIHLFDIRHTLNSFIALTSSRGPKRKWTSSDALGFCMCFFSLACRGHSYRYTVRTRRRRGGNWWMWWRREVRSCDISPRGWRPASVSAGYQWTLLQRGAWLAGSACPL